MVGYLDVLVVGMNEVVLFFAKRAANPYSSYAIVFVCELSDIWPSQCLWLGRRSGEGRSMESARFVCLGGQGMQWEAGKQGKVYGKTQVRIRLSNT